ncbi:odorant receptor 82a-like [Ptiloglossa arizonensis]|uniref:odorant receptor 82a-like n=1 Tax=Ptiloglossa arizonensis TaxID=3350558 RepID=UPI003FA04C61
MDNNGNLHFRNVRYESDADYTIFVSRILLTPIGMWPLYRTDTFLNNVKGFLHVGMVFGLMCFLLIPHMIYTFHDYGDLSQDMKLFATQTFSFLGIVKFCTLILKRKQIGHCLMEIETQYRDIECEDDRQIMMKSAKIGRFCMIAYVGLSYGGGLTYHIVLPFMSEKIVKTDNTTQFPLPYLSNYVLFVIEGTPLYEMTFVLQMLISTMIMSSNIGVNTLIATTVIHSYSLFEIVNRKIETFFEDKKDDLHRRFKGIVRHHTKAIEFADMIQKGLSVVFLAEMAGTTLILCFLEYGVIMEWEKHKTFSTITHFLLMSSAFVNVFIISYIGDRLKQESQTVGETLYFMMWYDLPKDIANNIRIIMLRTNCPTILSAAKIFDLSLRTFCDICKTSAAYLNFLRTMSA